MTMEIVGEIVYNV